MIVPVGALPPERVAVSEIEPRVNAEGVAWVVIVGTARSAAASTLTGRSTAAAKIAKAAVASRVDTTVARQLLIALLPSVQISR